MLRLISKNRKQVFRGLFVILCLMLIIPSLLEWKERRTLSTMQPLYNKTSKENDPWAQVPNFEIFVRMFSGTGKIYQEILVPSMKLFMPNNTKLVVVLDNESHKDHVLGNSIVNSWPYPRVYYEDPHPHIYHKRGHGRQQWSMFYPENYTKAEYVAVVDTDTAFITTVTPKDLFDGVKPIIIGAYMVPDKYWSAMTKITADLFGGKFEVMRCMSYFPVVIKVQHVIELRKLLERIHGKPFDEIFRDNIAYKKDFCQFCIMCQYLFFHRKEEYSFYLQMGGKVMKLGDRAPPSYYQKYLSNKGRMPIARVSYHWKYQSPLGKVLAQKYERETYIHQALLEGVCRSGGFKLCPQQCKYFNETDLHYDLFNFEFNSWTWDSRCMEANVRHYSNVAKLIATYQKTGQWLFGDDAPLATCQRLEKNLKGTLRN